MANILILNYEVPNIARLNGNTLRVFFLSQEFSRKHSCYLAAFKSTEQSLNCLGRTNIFQNITLLPSLNERRTFTRHFHLYTGNQTHVALPQIYTQIVNTIKNLIKKWDIDLIITFGGSLYEYVTPFVNIPKIIDIIDCRTLAIERERIYKKQQTGLINKLKSKLILERQKYFESQLSNIFDFVITVSPVDRDYLRSISRNRREYIIDIPNGVNPDIFAFDPSQYTKITQAISFWGALDFSPNLTAIHYFYDEIFLPFLADKQLTWYIIGKNPSHKMQKFASKHSNIILTGYVDDLYGLISRIPLVINPMQIGGGLKNKILEAFALERLVISNSIGMEAIKSAKPDIHYIHCESPKKFAESIIKYSSASNRHKNKSIGRSARRLITQNYTWKIVGSRFLELINSVLYEQTDKKVQKTHGY